MASASEYELRVAETVDFLRSKLPARWVPEVAVVCGSGLTGLVNDVSVLVSVPYATIPHFPDSTVQGHGKSLVFGMLGGKRVVALTGRFHFYEGLVPSTVMYGVRTVAALGAKVLIVTNAAGGVNPAYEKGDIMMIADHISFCGLAGVHPLVGHNDALFGPRFPPVTNAYTPELRRLARAIAEEKGVASRLREGVYVNVSGPSYETRSEIGLMRALGGCAVGMSTVFEVLAAAHAGMRVVGFSLVTNKCVAPGDDTTAAPSHAEVLEASNEDASKTAMTTLVREICARVDTSDAAMPPTDAARAFADTAAVRASAPKAVPAPAAAAPAAAATKCSAGAGGHAACPHSSITAVAAGAGILGGIIGAAVAALLFARAARK